MGLVKTFLQIAVTLSLAVFISTPSVAAITPAATCADYSTIQRKKCNAVAGCQVPEGDNHCQQCEQGYYCPAKEDVTHKAGTPCPTAYPNSDLGSGAQTDCYFNIPAGYEYDISGTNIACHAGGYCPGVKIYYNNAKIDEWGWASCNDPDKISGANGRTTSSSSGSDELTDCYVICPNVPITNGYKQQYNQFAEATSGGKGTFPACNYETIKCNTGYKVNSSNDGCIAKTYSIRLYVDGNYEVKTVIYNNNMPGITPPTKTGYTFLGFFDSTDSNGTKYYNADGTSARKWDYDGIKSLYAKWQANTYYITYDLDSGSYGTSHPTNATYDDEFTVSNPTKKNYTFASWSIEGMSDDTHYINGTTYEGTTATTAATEFENLHSTNNASVRFIANWTGKYYEVTLNDTCPDGAAHPNTCKIGTQTVACSATPNKIYEKYNTGWYLTTQGGATFSQLTVLPVCNKYKFTGFCKGTCSDTNNRVINASGAKTADMTNTMFSDDDTGTRQLTAHYAQCTCSTDTGAQSCSNTGTTEQNQCQFSISCKTGYSKDGTQTGSTNFAETVNGHQYTAICQAITYGFKIDKNGGTGGNLPTGTIEIKYDDPLKNLSSYTVPCKAGYVITGLEDKKDSEGTRYYTYDASTKALAAVTGKTWDKTENPTTLYVKYDACSGGKYCECTNKPNEKQDCPTLFTSDAPADAKTDCYMTGKINLSDKFGSKELDLDPQKLYLQQ